MDEWDLNDPKAEARLRSRFELNPRLRDSYLEDVVRRMPDLTSDRRADEAWNLCFAETREWYEGKRRALERKKRFYHGVQAAADFPTKGASSRLKIAADFVVQVYEADLIRRNLAYRSEIDLPTSPSFSPNDTSY